MFYNFKGAEQDRDYLRFLWFDKDLKIMKTHGMTRHIFGIMSSPGVATYGLQRTAGQTTSKATESITRDFYVDNGVISINTVEEAVKLVTETAATCKTGNLRLHKICSNSSEVLTSIPESEHSIQEAQLAHDHLPEQKHLECSGYRKVISISSTRGEKSHHCLKAFCPQWLKCMILWTWLLPLPYTVRIYYKILVGQIWTGMMTLAKS